VTIVTADKKSQHREVNTKAVAQRVLKAAALAAETKKLTRTTSLPAYLASMLHTKPYTQRAVTCPHCRAQATHSAPCHLLLLHRHPTHLKL
jgi:hypothetical protein